MVFKEDIAKIQLTPGTIVKQQWKVIKKLGEGGCGVVVEVSNVKKPNQHAALKAEPFGMISDDEILKMEAHVLKKLANSKHACKLLATGKGPNFYYICMSLLGRSLSEIRRSFSDQRFSIPTTIHVGIECLEAIEQLHDAGFVHRDIKPSNFAIGRTAKTARSIYIYDFGLCREFMITDAKGERKLREPRKNVPFKGTVRYASLGVHRREDYGRHDDLWSMLYMLVEMILAELPWHKMDRAKAETAKETSEKQLMSSSPKEFIQIFRHLRKLNYNRKPDYKLVNDAFQATLKRLDLTANTYALDWEAEGRHGNSFQADKSKNSSKSKLTDEKREADNPTISSDLNTRYNIGEIKEEALDSENDDPASRISGKSEEDETLRNLNDLK